MKKGDIIQITDPLHKWFPCLIVVDEVKSFGVQGYAFAPTPEGAGQAYIRLERANYEEVGASVIVDTEE